ncbi:MAG: AraC family transcriptional regulator [Novosphingobium sp.]|uniref:AraC family transcriptional regulator ligand-binding domain-containing protein n=1 Tax=Novosphingobium sp. TaxID=1874826 RepID=UPI003C7A5AEF
MELVRAASLSGYYEVAEDLRLDTPGLLKRAGLARASLADPDRMIPARSVVYLLEESAKAANCPSLGVRMAQRRTIADLGMVSLLIAHQPTLREAFNVMQRYRNRINSTLVLQVEESRGVAVVQEQWVLDPPLVSRQSDELALGVLAGLGLWLLGSAWHIHEVHCAHPTPDQAEQAIYTRLFDAPLRFGSDFTGIVISAPLLDLPNPRADVALAAHARRMAETMMAEAERSLEQEVEEAILLQLPAGGASIAATARALGLHPRTLQRRLEGNGQPFAEIREIVRRRQAARYLANPRLTITEVAELSGYASLSAFTRWHRQAFGRSPSRTRNERGT